MSLSCNTPNTSSSLLLFGSATVKASSRAGHNSLEISVEIPIKWFYFGKCVSL